MPLRRRKLVAHITDEGFANSEVKATATYLADHIGGRLTNSPAMREAERWSQSRLWDWGFRDVRAEPFDFGRGWSVV